MKGEMRLSPGSDDWETTIEATGGAEVALDIPLSLKVTRASLLYHHRQADLHTNITAVRRSRL